MDFLQDALARRFLEAARLVCRQEMGREITDRSKGRQDPSDPGGAAAFGGPGGLPPPGPAKQKSAGRGPLAPAPRSFRALRAPPPPPLDRRGFHRRQKRQQKARPRALWGLAAKNQGKKGAAHRAGNLGQSPGPRPTGPGSTNRPPRAAASGRPRPLMREYRRPRRAAVRAALEVF